MTLYYPQDLDEAKKFYQDYVNLDPFPDISAALLTSSDIQDYVSKTGMICPFNPQPEYFKPACYGVSFSGEYLYWDIVNGETTKIKKKLESGESFTLKRNSITYVQLQPYFQLPNYIAARFNLQIKQVYRGLLLGTGPLVDPGYTGYLNIPVHNLTDEDYEIEYHEQLIWMEFTKLNYNPAWTNIDAPLKREGVFYPFKDDSKDKDMEFFIHKAHKNSAIISTMQGVIADIGKVKRETEDLNKETKGVNDNASRATSSFNRAIVIAVIGIFFTGFFTIYQMVTLQSRTLDTLKSYDEKSQDEHRKFMDQQNGNIEWRNQVANLNETIRKQDERIRKLEK